jgi:ketosteroid isomerase-like protein
MPATTAAADVAVSLLEAWSTGDFETARSLLAGDVTFVGPLGETTGAEAYVDGVRGLAQIVERVEVLRTVTEGDDVCARYDLVTKPAGPIPTVGWYTVSDGRVASVRAFFDPRPLLAG